ncbi:class I SAM-dependent methyltransferase [Pontibacter qinzhouensis]|uniref:Class I SAM-dependent methyltransferase n=1 Tax=Pontibacter qinzhouensis TaxID=2603253 RepID=A0A5C8JFW3_9BACT|nr:class I SAM-dependent methyltransferase [Pontibacter qinzhouensis]TXK36478.1 class I SAM-dependent methyltransferase [Pontibacter qinzhouensis]
MNCRFCKTPIHNKFVDLVNCPPSNSFLSEKQLNEPEVYYPLTIYVCHSCHLVQVDEHKKATDIFNNEYVYFSSYSKSWVEHARRYVEAMMQRFEYNENSTVIEIASNDGYLLQHFKERGVPVLGIEPTQNTANIAIQKGIPTLTEYFGAATAQTLADQKKKGDLLIGNNVLAHVPDIDDFVEGLKVALRKNGVITMEFPHLLRLVEDCQFDTIYHEHFSYLSFTTVKRIFEAHGLTLFDVEVVPTHGGSLRIFVKHQKDDSKSISDRVQALLQKEEEAGITTEEYYLNFQERVDQVKYGFLNFLIEQKRAGKKVIGYGAAAKGNTLLNYAGIKGRDLLQFVVDAAPSKQNKFLPGSHIPVYDESKIAEYYPDYIIILPWNLKNEVMEQLEYVREWGCQFVTCVPDIKVYDPNLVEADL